MITQNIIPIKFSGDPDEWPNWSEKFITLCDMNGLADIIEGNVNIPNDTATGLTNDEKKIQSLNKNAYYLLMNSMTKQMDIDLIVDSKNSTHKRGNSKISWKKFKQNIKWITPKVKLYSWNIPAFHTNKE